MLRWHRSYFLLSSSKKQKIPFDFKIPFESVNLSNPRKANGPASGLKIIKLQRNGLEGYGLNKVSPQYGSEREH